MSELRGFVSVPPTSRRVTASMAVLALLLAGCSPGWDKPTLPQASVDAYRLGVDDQVRVITFGMEQLTGQFRVNDRGVLAIPLLGAIEASGLTTAELERAIEARLKAKEVLLTPTVSVEVLAYRPVFILGEVNKPGQYPYQPGMTVLTAVAVAGGFTYRAQTERASILRNVDGHSMEGIVQRSTDVRPGDVIDVLDRFL